LCKGEKRGLLAGVMENFTINNEKIKKNLGAERPTERGGVRGTEWQE